MSGITKLDLLFFAEIGTSNSARSHLQSRVYMAGHHVPGSTAGRDERTMKGELLF